MLRTLLAHIYVNFFHSHIVVYLHVFYRKLYIVVVFNYMNWINFTNEYCFARLQGEEWWECDGDAVTRRVVAMTPRGVLSGPRRRRSLWRTNMQLEAVLLLALQWLPAFCRAQVAWTPIYVDGNSEFAFKFIQHINIKYSRVCGPL